MAGHGWWDTGMGGRWDGTRGQVPCPTLTGHGDRSGQVPCPTLIEIDCHKQQRGGQLVGRILLRLSIGSLEMVRSYLTGLKRSALLL